MAFPTGWGRKCTLVIQSSKVVATESNFPILLNKDTLPSEIFDADGSYPALNGGGDIRFSSNSDGSTQLACEIEQFITDNNPANGKAAIWVNVPSLASATNTSIWIWYNKAGESQPAEGATYGKHAVWDSNFKMIQHMNQDPSGSAPQMVDSTSNNNDLTSYGSMLTGDLVAGKMGNCLDFDGVNDLLADTSFTGVSNTIATLSCFAYFHSEGEGGEGRLLFLTSVSGWHALFFEHLSTNAFMVSIGDGSNVVTRETVDNVISLNTWHHVAYSYDGVSGGTGIKIYIDGSEVSYAATTGTVAVSNTITGILIGANNTGGSYAADGLIDEVCVSNIVRSAGWIETEYNNRNSPSTFIIEGTPETPGAPPSDWTGIFCGVTNPAKVLGISVSDIAKVCGVS